MIAHDRSGVGELAHSAAPMTDAKIFDCANGMTDAAEARDRDNVERAPICVLDLSTGNASCKSGPHLPTHRHGFLNQAFCSTRRFVPLAPLWFELHVQWGRRAAAHNRIMILVSVKTTDSAPS
jgi:hypothetical protein